MTHPGCERCATAPFRPQNGASITGLSQEQNPCWCTHRATAPIGCPIRTTAPCSTVLQVGPSRAAMLPCPAGIAT